jgi:hypothetical protein
MTDDIPIHPLITDGHAGAGRRTVIAQLHVASGTGLCSLILLQQLEVVSCPGFIAAPL